MNSGNITAELIEQSLESNSNLILEDDAKNILKSYGLRIIA